MDSQGPPNSPDPNDPQILSANRDPETGRCIELCFQCARVCEETIQYALKAGGMLSETSHISLLMNCAMLCQVAAQFMVSDSPFHLSVCAVTADVCETLADECHRFSAHDPVMRQASEVCRQTSESCRRMSDALRAA